MAKFRKKPVVIEAEQFIAGAPTAPDGICFLDSCKEYFQGPHVHTLEGSLHVSSGDWIITGVKGEKYPCKPDIFEATYEPLQEATRAR